MLLFVCVMGVSVVPPARAEDWTAVSTAKGVTIYRRELPGSHLTAMKGTGSVEAPVWKVASILSTPSAHASGWTA
jgi:hypothetical protein